MSDVGGMESTVMVGGQQGSRESKVGDQRAEIGEPVPGELVDLDVTRLVEDTDVEGSGVEIDSVVQVLLGVESHRGPPPSRIGCHHPAYDLAS
jgi:hypothetical protein